METIRITIDDKKPYSGEAERHPEGDFYENGAKYTCWDDKLFEQFNIGDDVEIIYTVKTNGTFTNRNISKMTKAPQVVNGREVEVIKIGDDISKPISAETTQIIRVGNLEYELTLRLLG